MKKPPIDKIDKIELLQRSYVAAVKDRRAQANDESIAVQREVVQQLDAIEPNLEVLRDSIAELLKLKGSEGCFQRDPFTQLSVIDALSANKERPGAAAAVQIVTDAMARKIHRENEFAAAERARREARESESNLKL